jgi:glycosyltransferase involved in cell wall biosynthesis
MEKLASPDVRTLPHLATPTISVVIPTYNRAQFIAETIRSALGQTRLPLEIIVVDDGSTDRTREALQPFIDRAEIRCFFRKNTGVGAARNFGIRAAAGDYVAFLDDDDRWLPKHLEQLASAVERHPRVQMAFSGFEFFASDERSDRDFQTEAFRRSVAAMLERGFVKSSDQIWLSKESFLTALFELGFTFRIQGAMLSRKLLLDRGLFFDEAITLTQDGQFVLEAALHTPALFVPATGVEVRRHVKNSDGSPQDRGYQDQVVKDLARRIARTEAVFKNRLNPHERRALMASIRGMQSNIMLIKSRTLPYTTCIKEGLLLLKTAPCSESVRSLVKVLLGRRLLALLQARSSGAKTAAAVLNS